MLKSRLDTLADSIFAIVMTILVFEIRVPEIAHPDNTSILKAVISIYPLILTYLLSFSLLFTYWRAHHFIISVGAKNLDSHLTNYNTAFFFLIALVPFSSQLLGKYSEYQIPIFIFGLHVCAIGICLYLMREYMINSVHIENDPISPKDNRHAMTRILLPVLTALIAIFVSFFSTKLALALFTIGIIYNLSSSSTHMTFTVISNIIKKDLEN